MPKYSKKRLQRRKNDAEGGEAKGGKTPAAYFEKKAGGVVAWSREREAG